MTADASDKSAIRRLMRLPGSRPWAALGLLTAIFISGAMVGAGLAVIFRPEHKPRRRSMDEIRDRLTDQIAEGIGGLSDRQTDQLRRIVGEQLDYYVELRKEIEPRMIQSMEVLHVQVAALLTEEQKPRWEEHYAKLFEKWHRKPPPKTQPAAQP